MTPLRLLIVALCVYAAWRLWPGGFGKKRSRDVGERADGEPQDILVEDPVCRVLLPKNQAIRRYRDGVTYYFCSERCCDLFNGKVEEKTL